MSPELSPFELKDQLIALAQHADGHLMLNAGRGNPNFLAVYPRQAFLRLGEFALEESQRSYAYLYGGFGGASVKEGVGARFNEFLVRNKDLPGTVLLRAAFSYMSDQLGLSFDDTVFEFSEAFLGCNYPVPPRMLTAMEKVVREYLVKEMYGGQHAKNEFDVFATEGGTAAMTYIFQSLKLNRLLHAKDKVAIVTPIFTPYLEIPELPEYDLEVLPVEVEEELGWQLSPEAVARLEDPAVKVLYVVNPSNPPSVKMSSEVLGSIAALVREKRQDLMIITDDVYGTFADDFLSLAAMVPANTLLVYSFSKYFGATGWRLGAISLARNNVFDDKIAALPKNDKDLLEDRYSSLTKDVPGLKFIDRLVADSRAVALNHTSGLSLPQQLQMALFSLFALIDSHDEYKNATKTLIRKRYDRLMQSIGVTPDPDENAVEYYTLLDLQLLGEHFYSKEFGKWILDNKHDIDFLFTIAKECGVVMLPGNGFDDTHPSARVSLANLA
ncbi:MAG: bifunctional aspartate transaminase/aspartate 4-decarboxylase, partial [Desulfovibrionaceae bacterium]